MGARPEPPLGHARRTIALVLIAATLAVHVEGCSAPTRLTRRMEHSVPDDDARRFFDLGQLTLGTDVVLALRDGTVRSGTYRGLGRLDPEIYAERFARLRPALAGVPALPSPGDSISLVRHWGRPHAGRLVGYGFRSVEWTRTAGGSPEEVPFDRFETLSDRAGNTWRSDSLTLEAELGRVPSFAAFELEKPSGRLQVPLDEVETVTWRNQDGDVVTGVLLLAGVVALVGVIVIASSLNHLGDGCMMASAPSVRTYPAPPAPSPGS